eukprot:757725-Amphidinium_carterae.2
MDEVLRDRVGFTQTEYAKLKMAFERYDTSGDGRQDGEENMELRAALVWMGMNMTPDEIGAPRVAEQQLKITCQPHTRYVVVDTECRGFATTFAKIFHEFSNGGDDMDLPFGAYVAMSRKFRQQEMMPRQCSRNHEGLKEEGDRQPT